MVDTYEGASIGFQANSLRKTASIPSLSKATRDEWQLVHISKAHDKLSPGRDSPGPIYHVQSTVGQARIVKFGTGPRQSHHTNQLTDSSIDLLGVIPDTQKILYPSVKGVDFGMDSRDVIKNATILKNHPQAFFGTHSPGPALYTLPDKIGKDCLTTTIAGRTKQLGAVCQTPVGVGPGSYEVTTSIPINACKFPLSKQRPAMDKPNGRCSGLYNTRVPVAIGPQSTKPSAPNAIMGKQTRAQWKQICLVGMDRPVPLRLPHPILPTRMDIIKWSS